MIGEVDVVEREVDASGQVYMTAAELMAEEVKRRGGECGMGEGGLGVHGGDGGQKHVTVAARAAGRGSEVARRCAVPVWLQAVA